LAGVRPPPGAATSQALSALDFSPTFLLPHVAAAGDGCTPFRLRLRLCVSAVKLQYRELIQNWLALFAGGGH
jgi:hypothetical protein